MKMERAMALARRLSGTLSMMSVLIGPVGRNSRSIESARKVRVKAVFVQRKAINDVGTASRTEQESSQAYPAGFRFCHTVAAKPPESVPTRPATTRTNPKKRSAHAVDSPCTCSRKVGPQNPKAPRANVHAT